MATQNLGKLGPSAGQSVLFRWRWHYSLPGLPLWILLVLLAIVPRQNRNLQPGLIVILPLLVIAFLWLIEAIIPGPDSVPDGVAHFCTALAVAWASVWLLGPWLHGHGRLRNVLAALAVMVVVGAAAYVGFFGLWMASDVTWPLFGFWAVCSVSLVVATSLSGYVCGRSCSPHRLLFWPAVWIPVMSAASIAVLTGAMALFSEGTGVSAMEFLFMIAVQAIVVAGMLSVMLYLLNLPVLLLCILSPCYQARFRDGFGWPGRGAGAGPTSY